MPFYAYIIRRGDSNLQRGLLVFADKDTAEGWWTAMSNDEGTGIQRVSDQFFSYDPVKLPSPQYILTINFPTYDPSRPFLDKMFVHLLPDGTIFGVSIPIIPPEDDTDAAGGKKVT